MTRSPWCLSLLALCLASACLAAFPRAVEQVTVTLPDFGAELRAFDDPVKNPVGWWPHVVNAGWGEGRGGPERKGGWLDDNWQLIDYIDRSADYTTHDYLTHRGIWYEVYGLNEYQETIHFHEEGARKLLWDNGIARDMKGERVLSPQYNMKVQRWAKRVGWDAYITCNNSPRWSSIINYDWLSSPLLGFAISQDNIGGPTSRIGAGGHGRYCDHCNRKFLHYLQTTGRLPEFRARYSHIRDYVQEHLSDVYEQLFPYVKHRFDQAEAELLNQMCRPPVMSEYQKFLYISHLHNFVRYYRDAHLLADRVGREYDVHGNQGGGFVGPNPYQIALSDFVDTVWFETNGMSAYDMFKYHWNNAWGAFRYEMGRAMTRGRKPFMSMTGWKARTPDIVEHEMAEACAGGGVLFVSQLGFAEEPQLLDIMTRYFRLRHHHRALFADGAKTRYAQVAVLHSIPTLMYHNYQHEAAGEPINALSGVVRALEEGHIPYDVLILKHPQIHADDVTADILRPYKLLILPALECLSAPQIAMLTDYVRSGGALGVLGQCGTRDEDNLPREASPVEGWRRSGRVVDILPDGGFLPSRTTESETTRELTDVAVESVRDALDDATILTGALPRLLWVKTWRHGDDCISLHFVNYDVDFESGRATATGPAPISLRMPEGLPAEEAVWLTADGKRQDIEFSATRRTVSLTVPAINVYGVLVIGREGLDAAASATLQGNALLARARMACGGDWGELQDTARTLMQARRGVSDGTAEQAREYAQRAAQLLDDVRRAGDEAYAERVKRAAETSDAIIALDFGAEATSAPWKLVGPDSEYDAATGFGWLPVTDTSEPTPEELYYDNAQRYGARFTRGITAGKLLFWPYIETPPPPLRRHLSSGQAHEFRVDVPSGDYTVRVVTTNPAWTNRNFQVSGMVGINGAVRLLDAPLDKGSLLARDVSVSASEGKLQLKLGGPTGWGLAALIVYPQQTEGPPGDAIGALRSWRISPRYANPDWYPIRQVSAPPEQNLRAPATDGWTAVSAPPNGIPLIDLGSNLEAEVGDVVYATATVSANAAGQATLRFGASSSAQLWLNGGPVAYVPNEKGVRKDELVAPIELRAGDNTLVVKLQRFWERHWQFYAAVEQ